HRRRRRHLLAEVRQLAHRRGQLRLLRRQHPGGPDQHRYHHPALAGDPQRRHGDELYGLTAGYGGVMLVTRRAGLLAAALVLAALAGCNAGAGPFPVEGTVVWDDDGSPAKELHWGSVLFELPEKQIGSRRMIQSDGTFRLTTT